MRFMTMLALASGILLATSGEASAFGKRRGNSSCGTVSSSCGTTAGAVRSSGCAPCSSGVTAAQATSFGQPCGNCPTGFGAAPLQSSSGQVQWHPQYGFVIVNR